MGRSLWRHRNLPGLMSELNPMNVKQRWVLTDNLLWVDHRVGRLRTAVLLWYETHAKRIALMQEARPRLTVSRVATRRQTRTGGWKLGGGGGRSRVASRFRDSPDRYINSGQT